MKPYLLDTNVLIALAWPNHVHHSEALRWFSRKRAHGFRTCPLTQCGFVRISSNPAFTRNAVTPAEALQVFERIVMLPGHQFWQDDLSLPQALASPTPIVGHRQVTDAYLVSLAEAHGGILATLDRGVAVFAAARPGSVEILFEN